MRNLFISAGIVAAGIAGLQSGRTAALDIVSPKAWAVSATLRGFYDDNYNIANNGQGSFGAELSPSISFNVPMRQTDIGLRYTYGLYYYQDRDALGLNPFDQTHQVDVWLDHSFSERWKVNFTDNFAVGQEPELIGPVSPSTPNGVPYRVTGNNLANHATITLETQWTRQFSTALHYGNNFYDYSNKGTTAADLLLANLGLPGGKSASLAGLLNRVEQSGGLDLEWQFQPETMGFVGYQFSIVNYTGGEPIALTSFLTRPYMSNDRDAITHYGYVGVKHQFSANLSGSVRGGVSYTDSYNDPLQTSKSLAPYADLSLSYAYLPGSYAQLGFMHDINSTDVASVDPASGSLTQYQESSVLYASVNHHFTPKLMGTLIGRCQYSTYQGGPNSNVADTSYGAGVNLHYQFTTHFSTEVGYNFDDLVSDIANRGYTRNRVYIGLGVTY